MLTVAIPKRNKLQNIIVLTPKDGVNRNVFCPGCCEGRGQEPLLCCMQKNPESGWTISQEYDIIRNGILDWITV